MRDVWIMADTKGTAPIAPLLKVCLSPSGQPGDHADPDGNYLGTWFKVEQVPDDIPNGRVVALLFDAKPGAAHHTITYAMLTMAAVMGCPCCMH
ncbi:hypothetical protein [Methylocaldum sp.]|uniref:hypothetical protein n=1 Tax=Methylocaldum sp. TaxID=1969727 RepID=UPI002D5D1B3A|nr:hypothetical protein [Methylocaldum sp.]HYE34328.1 hypothetical protein [Methylocaldum sp.]